MTDVDSIEDKFKMLVSAVPDITRDLPSKATSSYQIMRTRGVHCLPPGLSMICWAYPMSALRIRRSPYALRTPGPTSCMGVKTKCSSISPHEEQGHRCVWHTQTSRKSLRLEERILPSTRQKLRKTRPAKIGVLLSHLSGHLRYPIHAGI